MWLWLMQIHINCNEQLQVYSSPVLKVGQEEEFT